MQLELNYNSKQVLYKKLRLILIMQEIKNKYINKRLFKLSKVWIMYPKKYRVWISSLKIKSR